LRLAILYNLREKSCAKIKNWQSYSNPRDQIPLPDVPPLYVHNRRSTAQKFAHFGALRVAQEFSE
jgi:hypothetical protein